MLPLVFVLISVVKEVIIRAGSGGSLVWRITVPVVSYYAVQRRERKEMRITTNT